jgi:hypothetical protein
LRGVTASRAGRYQVTGGTSEPISVAASLLSAGETTLAAVDAIEFDEQTIATATEVLHNDRPLWSILTLLAFCVLIVEWWFFQRPGRRTPSLR